MPPGKKYGGRKKGTPNKFSGSVKNALEEVFVELGSVPAMVNWARRHRTQFYVLWSKMLPKELNIKAELDDSLGEDVRKKLHEVDSRKRGQSGEAGGTQPPDVGDAAAPVPNQPTAPADGAG